MKLVTFLFFLTLASATVFAQAPKIEQMGKWRSANYSDVRYKLNITLEKGAPLMKGDIEIRVKLTGTGAKSDLVLDWRTTRFANDKDKPHADIIAVNAAKDNILYQENKEHLIIPKGLLKTGENVIKINFASPIKTSGAGITRYVDKEDGAEYFYTSFGSSKVSTAFPVFDQPDLKARFNLDVHIPNRKWQVISNGFGEIMGQDWFHTDEIYRKSETIPISPSVFAFAAGEFVRFNQPDPNEPRLSLEYTPYPIYVRKSQAEKFKQYAVKVYRLIRAKTKTWKLDTVLLPDISNVNAEYDGLRFMSESSVFKK